MASGGSKRLKSFALSGDLPEYIKLAYEDMGTNEALDGEPNPKVVAYIKDITGKEANSITTPWCAYFVGSKLKQAGYTPTNNGMARSYLNWGDVCGEEIGSIVIFWRGRKDDGITGHVGFLVGSTPDKLYVLGGNQGDTVCVQEFTRAKLLGFRKPRALKSSRTIKSALGVGVTEAGKVVADQLPDVASKIPEFTTTVEQVKGPLEQLAEFKPSIKIVLTCLTLLCILLTIYYRLQDAKTKGRA